MFRVGAATVQKVFEMDLNGFSLTQLLPDMAADLPERQPTWFPPEATAGERARMSVHAWLIQHGGKVLLIDTGAGNDKSRPQQKVLDHLQNPFLERLAAAGVAPEDVDYVLHTHIHSDHVGWNTRLVDGRWEPTFARAVHLCSGLEWRYGAALSDGDAEGSAAVRAEAGVGEPVRVPVSGTFADSMRPLEPTGRVRLVKVDGSEVLPGVRYLPAAGHSIDHAAIELTSEGQSAIFGGDLMHHPVELYDLDLVSSFCEFPEQARASRRRLLDRAARTGALFCSAHFPGSSAGRVVREGDGYTWRFEVGEPDLLEDRR